MRMDLILLNVGGVYFGYESVNLALKYLRQGS